MALEQLTGFVCALLASAGFAGLAALTRQQRLTAYGQALVAAQGSDILREEKGAIRVLHGQGGEGQGLGILMLTMDELYFLQSIPQMEFRIRRDRLRGATAHVRNIPGERGVIWVEYDNLQGNQSWHQWVVDDPDGWVAALSRVITDRDPRARRRRRR